MVTPPVFDATMRAEDTLVRLERFKAECQRRGWDGPSALVANLGRTPSFWSDLMNGRKSFGEKLARSLEEQMRLPRNAFDLVQAGHPASFADLNGFEGQLVTLFRQLSPDEQHEALRQLHQELTKRDDSTDS
jgi:hypothetical protein